MPSMMQPRGWESVPGSHEFGFRVAIVFVQRKGLDHLDILARAKAVQQVDLGAEVRLRTLHAMRV